ncbi:MAG: amidohydrolase family protein [Clostridiales bacterium]|nr:amidohydrolase family protein [Clostridiales bacterium]
MFGECHAHMIMDGKNYRRAVELHKDGVCESVIRQRLQAYQKREVHFIRDGGDALDVSRRAREIAPEYGIDYRSPVFAIHREGHYGSIVGRSYSTMKEYHSLVLEAAHKGADFIKIMTTGLLDFNNHGQITGSPLDAAQVKEMVHIAHEEGFAVMSHTNGTDGVRAAIQAGVDSVEHGNYMDAETIAMLADSPTIWVPTLVTIRNLRGCGRYGEDILTPIIKSAEQNLKLAFALGAKIAPGSDAGAYMVPHGQGIENECQAFLTILGDEPAVLNRMAEGEALIRKRFQRS